MAGTVETLRFAGPAPESGTGYPAPFLLDGSTSLKVRWVAPLLVNMSERSTDFLKYAGGPETFQFNNAKIEWVEDDPWNRRLSHGTLSTGTTTTLTVTGAAHRFPVGTILHNRSVNTSDTPPGEYVRVTGHVDANNLTIARDIIGSHSEGAWAAADEVFVAGFAMHENDNWVFRPTSLTTMPFNYAQVHSVGVQATFRMMETAQYGLRGNDLDKQAADTVAEQFVLMEQEFVHGARFAGTSTVPAMQGGVLHYINNSTGGSQVTDLSGAALTRSDIDTDLQDLMYEVGLDKSAKTIIVGGFGKRKLSSFFSGAERLGPGTQLAGVVVDRLNTDFGVIDILLHTAVAQDELYFLRRENHKMGHHGTLGRPQLRQLPPSTTGPRVQQAFYADVSSIHSGPRAEGTIRNFSKTV